jgi:signal transduction histidine kinase/ligand-binding sensor domain-containing protein/CheY-like chemotaxis protein/AraC-like DNA-binding protein
MRFKAGNGLPHNTIYSVIKATDGRVYVGTYNGFCYYNAARKRFFTIDLPRSLRNNNLFVNSLLEDRLNHCIWIGTEGDLYRYDLKTKTAVSLNAFHGNSVKTMTLDRENRLLAGTDDGLHIFDGKTDQYVRHDSRNFSSLAGDIVWGLFTDAARNVWVGTDNGISIVSTTFGERFIPISQITGTGNGNQFYAIFRDAKSRLWLGGSNGLIQTNIPLGGSASSIWYRVDNAAFPLRHNHVRCICQDREKKLWLATDGGIMQYEEGSRQWKHYNLVDRTHTYNANWAYDIFEDDRGRIWVATCLGGILVVDKHKLEQSATLCEADYCLNRNNGLAGMYIGQIAPDSNGNVWALLYNSIGVQKINMQTMRVSTVGALKDDHIGQTSRLLSDSKGCIWVVHPKRIIKFSHGGQQILRLPFKASSDCQILSMTEVKNEIWISSTDGIWIVNKDNGRIEQRGNDSTDYTSIWYSAADDDVYLGYRDGIAVTSPAGFRHGARRGKLLLTAIYVNGILETAQHEESIRYQSALSFSHDENHIVFCISDLAYSQSEKTQYAFRLQGVDKDWNILPSETNQITFNNLKAGDYRLLVKPVGSNGQEVQMLELPFTVLPSWYLTWWAKSCYVFMVMALLLWIINFYRVKNKLNIERIERRQIEERARLKMDFFANISHDFKTPLNMIIAPVSRLLLETQNENAKKQLETVERNAMKLNTMTQQILDFDRIESCTNSALVLSKVDYVAFAHKIFDGFLQDNFREKQQTGMFTAAMSSCYCEIDIFKMESAISNVLGNASKYTLPGGIINMEVKETDGQLLTIITDNGIGIPEKDLPYVAQRFFQSSKTEGKKQGTGIGLYLSRTYIMQHGGSFGIDSVEGKGTTVTMSLPLLQQDMPAMPHVEADGAKPVVLIVDDDAEMSGFIVDVLSSSFHCRVASDGKMGWETAKALLPNLIITDVMMPQMNGFDMCRHIRKYIPTSLIPIIMLTGKNDRQTELESIQLDIDVFLPKPFDANVLLLRSQQLVTKHEKQETKERIENLSTPKEILAVSGDEKFLQEITAMIEDRIGDYELNVNSLCEQYGISSKQACRKLKQLTGQTPVEYIKSIRMKKAAMLLGQHKFTIAEVMYMVGFSNSSYFSKCFQTEFGKTPRQYIEE